MTHRRNFLFLLVGASLLSAQSGYARPPALSYWRNGPLLFLGTYHTNSVDDPQIAEMRDHIAGFEADLILVEGGSWPEFANPLDAIAPYGELAYATNLAKSLGRRVADADPAIALEHQHTLSVHGADRTRLYYVLRMVPQFTRAAEAGGPAVEKAMAAWLHSKALSDLPETSLPLDSLDRLQELCARDFPTLGEWKNAANGRWWSQRTPTTESFLPIVQATAVAFRDEYIANRITTEIKAGKRVLVVAGGAHLSAARRLLLPVLTAPSRPPPPSS